MKIKKGDVSAHSGAEGVHGILRYRGISSMVISILLIASSGVMTMTGNTIIDNVIAEHFMVLGIILFLGGMILLLTTSITPGRNAFLRGEESRLVELVKERVAEPHRPGAKIVLDTSFLGRMVEKGHKFPHGVFGSYGVWLPSRVMSESNRHGGRSNQPLVPLQVRSYLLGPLGAKFRDYVVPYDTGEAVLNAWLNYTDKGRIARGSTYFHKEEQKRFKEGADMQILGLAYDRARAGEYTVILTEDRDIIDTLKHLNDSVFGRRYISFLRVNDVFG